LPYATYQPPALAHNNASSLIPRERDRRGIQRRVTAKKTVLCRSRCGESTAMHEDSSRIARLFYTIVVLVTALASSRRRLGGSSFRRAHRCATRVRRRLNPAASPASVRLPRDDELVTLPARAPLAHRTRRGSAF